MIACSSVAKRRHARRPMREMLACIHATLHNVYMNKNSAVRILNAVIASGVTRSAIAKRLDVHPSQVSRIAAGAFKRLDGHALRVCKYAQLLASRADSPKGLPTAAAELESKLSRLMLLNPGAAEALSEMLDALIDDERSCASATKLL